MRSLLRYGFLAFALSVGCDDGPPVDSEAVDDGRIESGYYTADGGFVADPTTDGSPSAGFGDAATMVGSADAGVVGDSGALAPTNTCSTTDCGTMPTTPPLCFDGVAADVECSPYFGSCSWQFVCGP